MPKKDTDMIDDVLSIYNYAEQKLLGVLAKHADNMTANKQLDQVQAFKKEITKIMQESLNEGAKANYNAIISEYKAISNLPIPENVKALVKAANDKLQTAHIQVLRDAEDKYRQIQSNAVAGLLTGVDTRRQATQNMLNQFVDKGINSFTDKAGRKWKLSSYCEMATRTASAHASLQANIDMAEETGFGLMKVSCTAQACPICSKWDGVVLATKPGTQYHTIEEAKASGLFHPNCKDTLVVYDPEIDDDGLVEPHETKKVFSVENKYDAIQKQRYNERQIRYWKERKEVAITQAEFDKANKKVKYWQYQNLKHCELNGIERKYYREGLTKAQAIQYKGPDLASWVYDAIDTYETTIGGSAKGTFFKMNLQMFASEAEYKKAFTKWIKKEITSLDGLELDKKSMSLTEVYKKYIGDTPSKDYKALNITDVTYAKWLKQQVGDIGVTYKIKPEGSGEVTGGLKLKPEVKAKAVVVPPPDTNVFVPDKTISPTVKYKKYVSANPSADYKASGSELSYAKWLKQEADKAELKAWSVGKAKVVKEPVATPAPAPAPEPKPVGTGTAKLSDTEKYKAIYGSAPSKDYKASGSTDTYAKWLKAQVKGKDVPTTPTPTPTPTPKVPEPVKPSAPIKTYENSHVQKGFFKFKEDDINEAAAKNKVLDNAGKGLKNMKDAVAYLDNVYWDAWSQYEKKQNDLIKYNFMEFTKDNIKYTQTKDDLIKKFQFYMKKSKENTIPDAEEFFYQVAMVYKDAIDGIESDMNFILTAEAEASINKEALDKVLSNLKTVTSSSGKSDSELMSMISKMPYKSSDDIKEWNKRFAKNAKKVDSTVNATNAKSKTYWDTSDHYGEDDKGINKMNGLQAIHDYTSGSCPMNFAYKYNPSAEKYFVDKSRYTREQALKIDKKIEEVINNCDYLPEGTVLRHGNNSRAAIYDMLGGDFDDYTEEKFQALLKALNSTNGTSVVSEKGFLSTSPFSDCGFCYKSVEVRIITGKKTKGIYVEPMSYYKGSDENEVILQHGRKYRFIKAFDKDLNPEEYNKFRSECLGSKPSQTFVLLEALDDDIDGTMN